MRHDVSLPIYVDDMTSVMKLIDMSIYVTETVLYLVSELIQIQLKQIEIATFKSMCNAAKHSSVLRVIYTF